MSSESRCWLCSGEIQASERSKTLGDLNVSVHIGCFDRLFETRGTKSWSDSPDKGAEEPPRAEQRPPAA
jgi:hypothetical protein